MQALENLAGTIAIIGLGYVRLPLAVEFGKRNALALRLLAHDAN
jgi:UDP-N-acetyl-D-mannosaminuronate dehydrogenase